MSKDHDSLDNLFEEFNKLRKSDISRAKPLFLNFSAGLQAHIAWEEDILFPIFERETGMRDAGPTAVMRMEHGQIKNFLEDISGKVLAGELDGIDELGTKLLQVLGSHNMKEENILYPAIDNLTNEQEKKQAIERMTELPSENFA
jgi:iron-sulfur cluster repair protein YtfE (RIC family)